MSITLNHFAAGCCVVVRSEPSSQSCTGGLCGTAWRLPGTELQLAPLLGGPKEGQLTCGPPVVIPPGCNADEPIRTGATDGPTLNIRRYTENFSQSAHDSNTWACVSLRRGNLPNFLMTRRTTRCLYEDGVHAIPRAGECAAHIDTRTRQSLEKGSARPVHRPGAIGRPELGLRPLYSQAPEYDLENVTVTGAEARSAHSSERHIRNQRAYWAR